MTEVIIDTDIRSKRRLPTWMKSSDASKNEKLRNFDELCSISGNQTETQGDVSMIESLSSEVDLVLAERKNNSEKKEIFAKKYLKKNTRKRKNLADSKDSTCNCSGTKRKSEGEIVERGKSIDDTQQMKLRSAKNNSVKVLSQVITEDEAELTVEDLISIAEEFLTSDEEKQNERKSESDSIPMRSSESSISHGGKLVGEIRSGQVLSKCSEKKPEESVASSSSGYKIIQSGDAAQDMLELFLGPLLKKAPPKDPKDPKETDSETTRELMASTYYESDSLMRNFVDVEEQAPLMMVKKKKSSLRDKVAVFF